MKIDAYESKWCAMVWHIVKMAAMSCLNVAWLLHAQKINFSVNIPNNAFYAVSYAMVINSIFCFLFQNLMEIIHLKIILEILKKVTFSEPKKMKNFSQKD